MAKTPDELDLTATRLRKRAAKIRQRGSTAAASVDRDAATLEVRADLLRLATLDLSDPYAPTPGDAVALRGGVLVEAEAWDLLAFDEAKFEAAEQNAQRIAQRDPARAARIRDLVGRMRAATVAHVEREAGL